VERHEVSRDRVLMPFPCFQINARFDGGMSGGPLVDRSGRICGIVSRSFEGLPVGYAAIPWPLLKTPLEGQMGQTTTRTVVDLFTRGPIASTDIAELQRSEASSLPD
jgi:hypothetical protein